MTMKKSARVTYSGTAARNSSRVAKCSLGADHFDRTKSNVKTASHSFEGITQKSESPKSFSPDSAPVESNRSPPKERPCPSDNSQPR